eukprot:1159640-Pelagomonas_calceolata.AAC.2
MDFSSSEDAPVVLASVQAPERFSRVAWGPRLQTEPSYPQVCSPGWGGDAFFILGTTSLMMCARRETACLCKRTQQVNCTHRSPPPVSSFDQMGIIAGGLADGSVCLWDPAAMLSGQGQPLLARMQKHTGAVKGLEFNAFSPNLLATGAADSDLCIWDLTKPSSPSLYPALKTLGPATNVQTMSLLCAHVYPIPFSSGTAAAVCSA